MQAFQSSPAPKDGRYIGTRFAEHASNGFNPRPPRRTGATFCSVVMLSVFMVFQSSPAPKDGRYGHLSAIHLPDILCFNPRPPRRTGATSKASGLVTEVVEFQSSPAPKDGRYLLISRYIQNVH